MDDALRCADHPLRCVIFLLRYRRIFLCQYMPILWKNQAVATLDVWMKRVIAHGRERWGRVHQRNHGGFRFARNGSVGIALG